MEEVDDPVTALADELIKRGLAEHVDFYIHGRGPDRVPSSEHCGLRRDGGLYRVWYRDMGFQRTLIETSDFARAREVLTREAIALAQARGRVIRPATSDAELSAAVVAYLRYGLASSPGADRDAVDRKVLGAVEALVKESLDIEIDWSSMSLAEASRHVAGEMGLRHPELTDEALAALAWNVSYQWR